MKRTVGVYNADISKDQSSAITVNKALNIAGAEPDLLKTQEALYTINKEAKKIRDNIQTLNKVRDKVKAYLFEGEYVNLTDEECEILLKFGVQKIDLSTYSLEVFSDLESSKNVLDSYWNHGLCGRRHVNFFDAIHYEETEGFEIRLEDTLDSDEMDVLKDIYGILKIDYDTEEADIRDIVKDDDIVEEIISEQEYTKSIISELETINDRNDRLHTFLREAKFEMYDLRERKKSLYDLKSAVLTLSGIAPVAYHEQDDGDLLAYYIWNGFKFHMPVDPLTIEKGDTVPIETYDHKDLISAENRLNNPPSLNEAIHTLLEFLHIEDITPQDYLSKRYDLEDRLGIEIYRFTRFNRFNSNSNVEEYYDDEYEYDAEYEYDDMY